MRVSNQATRGQGTGVAKLVKICSDAVLREDVNSRDIISADGRVACSGFRFRHGSPASTSFYARATRADALKKAAAWRLSAIGTALGGKPRRLRTRKQMWWTKFEGRGPIVPLAGTPTPRNEHLLSSEFTEIH